MSTPSQLARQTARTKALNNQHDALSVEHGDTAMLDATDYACAATVGAVKWKENLKTGGFDLDQEANISIHKSLLADKPPIGTYITLRGKRFQVRSITGEDYVAWQIHSGRKPDKSEAAAPSPLSA